MDRQQLGTTLRDLRQAKGLTLRQLADQTGVVDSTLSRMETGSMVGPLTSWEQIASALGLTLGELFMLVEDGVKTEQGSALVMTQQGMVCEQLIPATVPSELTVERLTLNRGAQVERHPQTPFAEAIIYGLSGRLQVECGGRKQLVEAGDSLYLRGPEPYVVSNTARSKSTALMVSGKV